MPIARIWCTACKSGRVRECVSAHLHRRPRPCVGAECPPATWGGDRVDAKSKPAGCSRSLLLLLLLLLAGLRAGGATRRCGL